MEVKAGWTMWSRMRTVARDNIHTHAAIKEVNRLKLIVMRTNKTKHGVHFYLTLAA